MPRQADRSRLSFVEAFAKRHKWRSVAFVGVTDAALVRQFLVHFPVCRLLVVPMWRDGLRPGEEGAQRNQQRFLRLWTRSYSKRLEVDEGPVLKVAGRMAGRAFDAVVFWGGIDAHDLGTVGAAWSPWVRDGGWMLGLDHRSEIVRGLLNAVASGWQDHREGIWSVRVRRTAPLTAAAVEVDVDAALPVDLATNEDAVGEAVEVPEEGTPGPTVSAEPLPTLPVDRGETHVPSNVVAETIAPKRRGGRPKGSKNKPKEAVPE